MKKIICANSHDLDIKAFRRAGYNVQFNLDTAVSKPRRPGRILIGTELRKK